MKGMKQRQKSIYLVLFLTLGFSLGCQTNEIKAFAKVQPGMEKGDVISIMGSPRRSERWHGKDRWTYVFYHDDFRYEKEVQFEDGKSSYVGDVTHPEISAEELDKKNEVSNRELEVALKAQRESNHQSSVNNHESAPVQNQIKYVPDFKPVQ